MYFEEIPTIYVKIQRNQRIHVVCQTLRTISKCLPSKVLVIVAWNIMEIYLSVAASLGVDGRNVMKMTKKRSTKNTYSIPQPDLHRPAVTWVTLAAGSSATHAQSVYVYI